VRLDVDPPGRQLAELLRDLVVDRGTGLTTTLPSPVTRPLYVFSGVTIVAAVCGTFP